MAKKLDISAAAIGSWENGRAKPRLDKLEQLAAILGTTPYYLLNGKEAPTDGALPAVGKSAMVPVRVLGTTHAGEPMEEIEDAGEVEVPAHVAAAHPNGFMLRVEGDCMDRVYPDGCMVMVDPTTQPRNGAAVVAETSPGESVLRRYARGSSTLMLMADSHGPHADIVLSGEEAEGVRLVGTVVWVPGERDGGVAGRPLAGGQEDTQQAHGGGTSPRVKG